MPEGTKEGAACIPLLFHRAHSLWWMFSFCRSDVLTGDLQTRPHFLKDYYVSESGCYLKNGLTWDTEGWEGQDEAAAYD